MSFQVSPGVQVKEIDLSNIIPATASSTGGFVGNFSWGSVENIQLVSSEKNLSNRFGVPTKEHALDFLSAANFLKYGNSLKVVRVIDDNAQNANTDKVDPDTNTSLSKTLVKNKDHYELQNFSTPTEVLTSWNNLADNSILLEGGESSKLTVGDYISGDGIPEGTTITDINSSVILLSNDHTGIDGSTSSVTLNVTVKTGEFIAKYPGALGNSLKIEILPAGGNFNTWTHKNQFESSPNTSSYVKNRGGSNDEMHIIVLDEDGLITGSPNTVLEKFGFVSQAKDAKTEDGSNNYYVDILNNNSQYVWFGSHHSELTNAGEGSSVTFTDNSTPITLSFTGGVNSTNLQLSDYIKGFDLLAEPELVDINLLMLPVVGKDDNVTLSNRLISIAETRKDCVAFVSPHTSSTVGSTTPLSDVLDFANQINSSSYGVIDSTAINVYDKYYDRYVWLPASTSIAGLCARTDSIADAWWSPAGLNRGQLIGVSKIAFNPKQAERDELYQSRVNPITLFPGHGIYLYGDKTAQAKPSAFDRINVRRLFILLEKSVANAAKYQLFEFNDSSTRAQFRGIVESFLREIKGRRGIYDFSVISDTSNNTSEVVDRNSFVADIYIKPSKSINFMTLNFIATRSGVEFSEVIGQ